MSSLQQKQVVIHNLLINYYQIFNQGKPVLLFLHGWRSEGAVWKNIITKLPDGYNIFALDLPGFGRSQTPGDDFNLKSYADVVESFVKKFNLTNIVLIGHSFGGRIAIKIAATNPGYLRKAVLVDSAGIHTPSKIRNIKILIAKMVKPIFKLPGLADARKKIYNQIGSQDYLATPRLRKIFARVINEDLTFLLKKIKSPVLLVWGSEDKDTPLSYASTMEQLVPNSELAVLKGAGHFSFLDKPEEFVNLIKNFVKN